VKILAISDKAVPKIHSTQIRNRFGDVELVLGCGDLPYSYMEYITTMLCVPCFFVHGNHDHPQHLSNGSTLNEPGGWTNLDGRTVKAKGLILGGMEGSRRYRPRAPYQYTEQEMTRKLWRMALSMFAHRLLDGRYLDILITHAPPCGIHDGEDACHQGFDTLLRFMQRFRPRYLLHGHQHLYRDEVWQTRYLDTEVINVYPYRIIDSSAQDGA
jgi:DNA repair exonuclease SbcCD nuclease subunit